MIYFTQLEDAIKKFARIISIELTERKYYEVEQFEAFAKTRLYFAISEIVKLESEDLAEKRRGLVEALHTNIPYYKKKEIQAQLAELKPKLAELNRVNKSCEDYTEYAQLQHYIKEKFGAEHVKDFFENYLNRNENNIHTSKRVGKK